MKTNFCSESLACEQNTTGYNESKQNYKKILSFWFALTMNDFSFVSFRFTQWNFILNENERLAKKYLKICISVAYHGVTKEKVSGHSEQQSDTQ